jgi:hypothetical protein
MIVTGLYPSIVVQTIQKDGGIVSSQELISPLLTLEKQLRGIGDWRILGRKRRDRRWRKSRRRRRKKYTEGEAGEEKLKVEKKIKKNEGEK